MEEMHVDETDALNGDVAIANQSQKHSPRFLLPTAAAIASLGGILFGYDIGIISGAMLLLRNEFMLSCRDQEMIVTALLFGGLFASLVGGQLLDQFGRKLTIILNALVFLLGALVLSFSRSYPIFVLGRFIVGFGVSLSAVADCVYISEIAPPHIRGLLVSLNEFGITLGLLIAYLVNYLLFDTENGWRFMFGISSIPAVLQVIGMFFLPESPRWLITQGKENKALKLMAMLWPNMDAKEEYDRLKANLSSESSYSILDLFGKRENLRMRMFVAVGIIFFQQLTGQPTVLYYAPVLFKTLGFDKGVSATLATVGLGAVKVLFTFITLCTVDKLGRRTFLLLGALIMTASLVTLSALTFENLQARPRCNEVETYECSNISTYDHVTVKPFNATLPSFVTTQTTKRFNHTLVKRRTRNCTVRRDSEGAVIKNGSISNAVKYTCLLALMFFVIGYAVGYGPMSWLVLSEIFPTAVKGRAVAIATSVNWGTNILISMTFLDILVSIGTFWTFLIYAMIGVLSVFFLCNFVPETKGKSLEMISAELNNSTLRCGPIKCCVRGHVLLVDDESNVLLDDQDEDWLDEDVAEETL